MVTVFSKSNLIASRLSLSMIKKNFRCHPLQTTIRMKNLTKNSPKSQLKFKIIMMNMNQIAITNPQYNRRLKKLKFKKRWWWWLKRSRKSLMSLRFLNHATVQRPQLRTSFRRLMLLRKSLRNRILSLQRYKRRHLRPRPTRKLQAFCLVRVMWLSPHLNKQTLKPKRQIDRTNNSKNHLLTSAITTLNRIAKPSNRKAKSIP